MDRDEVWDGANLRADSATITPATLTVLEQAEALSEGRGRERRRTDATKANYDG